MSSVKQTHHTIAGTVESDEMGKPQVARNSPLYGRRSGRCNFQLHSYTQIQ